MAPRSTGCRTCVRRRVKCDETRPNCERCQKAKLQCDGFREALIFVDETRQTYGRLGQSESTPATTTRTIRRSPPKQSDSVSEGALYRQFRLSALSDDLYFSYLLRKYIATGVEYKDYFVNKRWMVVCLTKPEEYPTAILALKCLATSFFGRKHREDSITQEGAAAYGPALLALRQTLQDPVRAWSFDALAATTALGNYEYLMFTTRRGWIQHAQGVGKLMEMRGPECFKQWPERAILESNKVLLITQSLVARKRSFLEEEGWTSIRGPHEVDGKDFMSALYDIFAKLPGIAEVIQDLETSTVDLIQVTDDLEVTRIGLSNLLQELEDWYTKLTFSVGPVALEMPVDPGSDISSDVQGPLFDTLFDFASLKMANAFANYCAIKIAALEWQQKLADLSWQRGADHEGMLQIPGVSVLALDICRYVEYLLQPAHAQVGAFYMILPARIAYYALPKWSREAQWLAVKLETVADTSGFEMARNILNNIPIRRRKKIGGVSVLKYSPSTSESATESLAPSESLKDIHSRPGQSLAVSATNG